MEKFTNREIISRVRGLFKLQSADTLINMPDRLILSEIDSTTLRYIKQATDKRKLWNSPNLFSLLPCVQMKEVPLAECCSYASNCMIARSVVRLPRIAEGTNFGMLIQGVYAIDFTARKFIESTPDRYSNSLSLGDPSSKIHFWIWDGYLYIGEPQIVKIRISAFFEEDIPESLLPYPAYCNNPLSEGCCPSADQVAGTMVNDQSTCCPPNVYDNECHCPGYMLSDVINESCNRLLQTYKRSASDDTNNRKDDSK